MLRTLSKTYSQTRTTSRRSNSRRPPSILVTAVDSPTHRQQRPSQRLPTEIVDRIIELAVVDVLRGVDSFSSISSFSLASTHFRRIFLRKYLECVVLRSKNHWNWLFQLARKHGIRNHGSCGLVEIKTLTAEAGTITAESLRLSSLVNLRALNLTFEEEGPSTQRTCVSIIFTKLLAPFPNCSSSLQKLTLTYMPRIDISLLRSISSSFPLLSDLRLSASDRVENYNMTNVCWCCFEELLSCSYYSPIPYMFSTADGLAAAFGQALQPLGKLKRLHLGVYLSDEELWWNHISCCKNTVTSGPEECKKCEDVYSSTTRLREDIASATMVSKLPSLRSVSWNSYFNMKEEREGNADRRIHFDVQEDRGVVRRRRE